jgi:hypothetical protein
VEYLIGTPLFGRILALCANIRLGWKGLVGWDTLACYEHSPLMLRVIILNVVMLSVIMLNVVAPFQGPTL